MPDTAYRICIVVPPGYKHASCFVEVAILLQSSFSSLGRNCDIKLNEFAHDRTNIVLGAHLLQFAENLTTYRYIPYQLEQLSEREGAYSVNLKQVLSHAAEVWDYSEENVSFLKGQGIGARLLPVGYHEALERVAGNAEKDVDVLFYGSLGGRRKPVLDTLSADPSLRVKLLFGVYGRERDGWISRSRVQLNVHYYSTRIFEAVRISYLLNNRCFVLSEESSVNPYPLVELPLVKYGDLVDACRHYVAHPAETDRVRAATYEQFRQSYPMTELLGSMLQS